MAFFEVVSIAAMIVVPVSTVKEHRFTDFATGVAVIYFRVEPVMLGTRHSLFMGI